MSSGTAASDRRRCATSRDFVSPVPGGGGVIYGQHVPVHMRKGFSYTWSKDEMGPPGQSRRDESSVQIRFTRRVSRYSSGPFNHERIHLDLSLM